MEFNPKNRIVKLCIQGMELEGQGKKHEALQLFSQAWNEATYDFEKLISAHFIARSQRTFSDNLHWLMIALQFALKSNDGSLQSTLPSLYFNIEKCYRELGDTVKSAEYHELAMSSQREPSDNGPFYHGTKADLNVGDLLNAGGNSNYMNELKMNHIYFTALLTGAGLAAALAKGENRQRVYVVKPTGVFENDPNVTDKKFPGNLTRSYRSESPLVVIGEVKDWAKQTTEEIQKWRGKLANTKGEIIN